MLQFMPETKDFLLKEGTDQKYGARHLKRAIERHLIFPLSSLISTGQIEPNEIVSVGLREDGTGLIFSKDQAEPSTGGETDTGAGGETD
jgi:ATP-dependent Clp protease ATP-binding subunit ClpA